MARFSHSSESELETFEPPEYTPSNEYLCIKRSPQPVCTFPGMRTFFEVCLDMEDADTLYVSWRVGMHHVTKPNTLFNVLCKNGISVLVIKRAELSMQGMVQVRISKKCPDAIVFLQLLKTYCIVVSHDDASLLFSWTGKFSQGHLCMLPVITSDTKKKKEKKMVTHSKISRLFKPRPGRSRQQCGDHTIIYIAFARFIDGIYYMNATVDKINKTDVSVYLICNNTRDTEHKYMLGFKWPAPKCRCQYAIEMELHSNYYKCIKITDTNSVEILAPKVSELITMRIRNIRELAVPPTISNIDDKKLNKDFILAKPTQMFDIHFKGASKIIESGDYGTMRVLYGRTNEKTMGIFLDIKTHSFYKLAKKELNILSSGSHHNIVSLVDVYRAPGTMVIVQEYLWGGTLKSFIQNNYITEQDASIVVQQILEGLHYLHKKNIAHFDLTESNIHLTKKNCNRIKITNFRKARYVFSWSDIRPTPSENIQYAAPEVLHCERCSVAADIWNVGVISYLLLSGTYPFKGQDNLFNVSSNILSCNYTCQGEEFKHISQEAIDFIKLLLDINKHQRCTAEQALEELWVQRGPPWIIRDTLNIPRMRPTYTFRENTELCCCLCWYHLRCIGRNIHHFFVAEDEGEYLPLRGN